jgi:23S rRNA-/tRNA-specific pseudouridylate synthase
MDFINITAIDKHSSRTEGITLSAKTPETLREGIKEFEKELTYRRYELVSDDFIEEFDDNILKVLDEFEVSI